MRLRLFAPRQMLPGLVGLTVLVLALAAWTTPGFFTVGNGQAIVASMVVVGMVATGMTLIMVSGAFVSLALATTATICAMLFMASLPLGLPAALAVTLAAGAATGAIQGLAIGGWGANPIVVTIAAAAVLEGVAVALSQGATITPTGTAYQMLNVRLMGLPVGVYLLVILVLMTEAMLRFTGFGRTIYLVGDGRDAARAAGLPLDAIGTGVFALAGGCAALAGIVMASFNHSASLLLSRGTLSYDAIAAVLIGGAAIVGGRGTVFRTMLGVAIIAVVTDLVLLRGFSTGTQILLKGGVMVVFALAVHFRQEETR